MSNFTPPPNLTDKELLALDGVLNLLRNLFSPQVDNGIRKIGAIKAIRSLTGLDLLGAKQVYESFIPPGSVVEVKKDSD